MAKSVKVHEAKTHLSALLMEVERGNEVLILRGTKPVARLVPASTPARELGFVSFDVPEAFFDDLPEEELAAWER